MPYYYGDAQDLVEITKSIHEQTNKNPGNFGIAGAEAFGLSDLPDGAKRIGAYIGGGILSETVQADGDGIEGSFNFALTGPIRKMQLIGLTSSANGTLDPAIKRNILKVDIPIAAGVAIADNPNEGFLTGFLSQSERYDNLVRNAENSLNGTGIPLEFPNGTRYILNESGKFTEGVIEGPVTNGELTSIRLEHVLESASKMKNSLKETLKNITKNFNFRSFLGTSGRTDNNSTFSKRGSYISPQLPGQAIKPGGGPASIGAGASGPGPIPFTAKVDSSKVPLAGDIIPPVKTPIPFVRGGGGFESLELKHSLEMKNLVVIDYHDYTQLGSEDKDSLLKIIFKFQKKLVAFTIISGILFLLFKNRKCAKRFLRKFIRFVLKLNRTINGLINRNRFTKALYTFSKVFIKSSRKPISTLYF